MKMFDMEIEGKVAAMENFKTARHRTAKLIGSLKEITPEPPKATYRMIQGRQEISATRRRLISEAQEEIILLTTASNALVAAEFDGTLDAILARENGPTIRLLLNLTPEAKARAAPLILMSNLMIRHLSTDRDVQFVVADRRELLLSIVDDPSRSMYAPDDVALLTTAEGLLQAERIFFDQCWHAAAPGNDAQAVRTSDVGRPS
jgi:sugar-specific transcriptional regulator TrmB